MNAQASTIGIFNEYYITLSATQNVKNCAQEFINIAGILFHFPGNPQIDPKNKSRSS